MSTTIGVSYETLQKLNQAKMKKPSGYLETHDELITRLLNHYEKTKEAAEA